VTQADDIVVQSYQLSARAITEADLPLLHELSVSVAWPHRMPDLQMFKTFGEGVLATDPIGRIVGSAMWFPMGACEATVGMVIISPRLQANGAGRWLMNHVMEKSKCSAYRLNATRAAVELYATLGFKPIRTIYQRQGVVRTISSPQPPGSATLRPATTADLPEIIALDQAAYGLSREKILRFLVENGETLVLELEREIIGFSLCRPAGRGFVIGPVVAEGSAAAIALIAPHINAHPDTFVRLDTPSLDPRFIAFLEDAGVIAFDKVTEMHLGAIHAPTAPENRWSLICQPFG
jgi:ribosomal protein S18 acetylase RimI-like enzyme